MYVAYMPLRARGQNGYICCMTQLQQTLFSDAYNLVIEVSRVINHCTFTAYKLMIKMYMYMYNVYGLEEANWTRRQC